MRLQLTGLVVLATCGLARADAGWRVTSDTLFYTDSDNVLVLSPQVAVAHALDDHGGSASARVVIDVVSAASVDVVSHATQRFAEVRTEADLGVSRAFGKNLPSLSYRYSHENDYTSHGVGVGFARDLGGPDTHLAFDYGVSFDTVGYTGTPKASFAEALTSHELAATLTQVLGPNTLLRGVYTLTAQWGYMAKPYRFVALFDQAGVDAARAAGETLDLGSFDRYRLAERPPEKVPETRLGHALGARLMRYLAGMPGSLRLDGQLYLDSWGILAGTFESALSWKLTARTALAVYLRLYGQQGATFWQRAYVVSGPGAVPRWRTVDRDLSPYVAISGGVRYERPVRFMRGYVDVSAMDTRYSDYLFLTSRWALITEVGLRLEL